MDNSIVKMGMIKYDDGKEYGAFFEIAGITFKLQKVKTKQAATLEVKKACKSIFVNCQMLKKQKCYDRITSWRLLRNNAFNT
jgi:hypothetical protein